jgi:hypothetical protein
MYERKLETKAASPADRETLLFGEPQLRSWRTRAGRVLDAQVQAAYRWIRDRADQRGKAEFRLADLGACFFKKSSSTPHEWVKYLEAEGLIEPLKGYRGPHGYVCVRVIDAGALSAYRVERGDPQARMEFVEEPDTLPFEDHLSGEEATGILRASSGCTEESSGSEVAAAGALPSALEQALRSLVGGPHFDEWLKPCRWEFSSASTQLFFPDEFRRTWVRRTFGAKVEQALAQLALPSAEWLVDQALLNILRCSRGCTEELPPNQPTNNQQVSGSASFASRNQPTNQPANDFWNEKRGECPQVVRRVAELYERIGDPTLTRGIAVHAIVLVEMGRITQADVDRLVAEASHHFNTALRALAGQRYLWIGQLRSEVRRRWGINWPDRWDHPRTPRRKPR